MVLLTFLHVSKCITLNQTEFVTATLIAKARLNSLYSRLGFKVIKNFAASTKFEEARERFNYESGKPKEFQKQTIGLQCYLTIPRHVTMIYDNIIDFDKYRSLYKYLNEVSPSDDWLPNEYIDAEFNKKLDKTKGRLAGNEMEMRLNITWNISITIPTG